MNKAPPVSAAAPIAVTDFKLLFKFVPGLYLVLTPELKIVAASDAYLRATMTRQEDIIGRAAFDVFPDNPSDTGSKEMVSAKASLERVVAHRKPDMPGVIKYDIPKPASEGGGFEERYWNFLNFPVFDDDGELAYVMHTVEDVSELVKLSREGQELRSQAVRSEKEVELSSRELIIANRKLEKLYEETRKSGEAKLKLLAAIVESSEDAILSKTLEGIILTWNSGAQKLYGYTADEAIGQNILIIIPLDRQQEEAEIIEQLLAGKTFDHYETVRMHKSGRPVHVSLSASLIRDGSGQVMGISKVARDITYRKEAEAKLLGYMRNLERSNKDLDDFAYISSHDLKEPLRGLFNNAKFLEQDYADRLEQDGVAKLRRLGYLCQRMEQLVNDLLYFSRLGRQELAIQPTDLNQVVEDIRTLMVSPDVTINIPHKLPGIVCDRPRVTEALRNLVTNGVKYNDKKNKVIEIGMKEKMETGNGTEHQVFYVQDNGIGIEEEFFEDIFRIFKRLNEEEDDKKGTGVGLTFVRKIVERHGGKIWLASAPGKGTTFYFTLKQQMQEEDYGEERRPATYSAG